MIKKFSILFCVLFASFVIYLVIPFPLSTSSINAEEFSPEQPTEFIPDPANRERCQDGVFYIKQSQVGEADSEVINERCASLQAELANAAIDGNLVEMRRLFQKGASAQSPAFSKHSSNGPLMPVITAAWDKQTQAIKLLLDNGADVNTHYSCCMSSRSLLMVAVTMNDAATSKLLLDRNADLSFEDGMNEGYDVFDEAYRVNNSAILEMLYNACDRSIASRIKCRLKRASHLFRLS